MTWRVYLRVLVGMILTSMSAVRNKPDVDWDWAGFFFWVLASMVLTSAAARAYKEGQASK